MNRTGVVCTAIVLASLMAAVVAHAEWTTTGPSWAYESGDLDTQYPADCEAIEVNSSAAPGACDALVVYTGCGDTNHNTHSGYAAGEACGWYVHSKSSPMDPEPVPGAASAVCRHNWSFQDYALDEAEASGQILVMCGGNSPPGGGYSVTYDLDDQGNPPTYVSQAPGGDVYDDDWSILEIFAEASLSGDQGEQITGRAYSSIIEYESSFTATCGPPDPPDPPGPPGP